MLVEVLAKCGGPTGARECRAGGARRLAAVLKTDTRKISRGGSPAQASARETETAPPASQKKKKKTRRRR
eukprot:2176108-Alexandrium_andersonii.AAC.1